MQLNVFGEPLALCCTNPTSGWQRDGYCSFYEDDTGMHQVCVEVTADFLEFSKQKGNDLSTPNEYFPGLKPGDKWCMCTSRFKQAVEADQAPKVYLKATSIEVLNHIPMPILKQLACDID